MAKTKTAYVCSECGADHSKWQGQCIACGAWNTLKEFHLGASKAPSAPQNFKRAGYTGTTAAVQTLASINLEEQPRFSTSMGEFDRVLGGGMVPGSAV